MAKLTLNGLLDGLLGFASKANSMFTDIYSYDYTWTGTTILFTKLNGRYPRQTVNSNLTLTPNSTNSILGAFTTVELKGTNTGKTVTLNGFTKQIGTYDDTLNMVNVLAFAKIEGGYIASYQMKYIDTNSVPIFISATITNAAKNKLIITTDSTLDGNSVPTTTDFDVTEDASNKAVTNVAIVGATVELTFATNFNPSSTVVLNYTAGTTPIRKSEGLNMADLINQNVTNSVTNPVTLNAPANLNATAASTNQINITWDAVAEASNYELWTSIDNVSFTLLASPAQSTTSYAHSGLAIGSTYYYYIIAVGDGVNYYISSNSTTVSGTTSSASALATPVMATPTIIGNTSQNITWGDVANEIGYQPQISTDGNNWSNLGSQLAANIITADATGLTAGNTYYYRVQGIGTGQYSNSAFSTAVSKLLSRLTLLSAATSTDGTYFDITGDRNISSGSAGITLYVGGVSKTFAYSVVSNKLRITPTVAFLNTDVITYDYNASTGNVTASDNTTIANNITGGSVTNTVNSFTITELANGNVSLSGNDIIYTGTAAYGNTGRVTNMIVGNFTLTAIVRSISGTLTVGNIGFSVNPADKGYNLIDFCLSIQNGTIRALQNNASVNTMKATIPVDGDIIELRRVDSTITYSLNNVLKYTSLAGVSTDGYICFDIYNKGIYDITLTTP